MIPSPTVVIDWTIFVFNFLTVPLSVSLSFYGSLKSGVTDGLLFTGDLGRRKTRFILF